MNRSAVLLLLTLVGSPIGAQADTITVTAGTIDVSSQVANIDIRGTSGFSVKGATLAFGFLDCFPVCEPERVMRLGPFLDPEVGTVTIDGVSHGLGAFNSVLLRLRVDPVVVPPLDSDGRITTPFVLEPISQVFLANIPTGMNTTFPLRGRGTVTVEFFNRLDNPFWEFESARAEFAPIPEPGTLLLVGIGCAGMCSRRLRQRLTDTAVRHGV
jgi:hypothetical protein